MHSFTSPATLYLLLSGIYRFMKSVDSRAPNLVDEKNVDLKDLHCTMDTLFRSKRKNDIGAEVKHESLLWEKVFLA